MDTGYLKIHGAGGKNSSVYRLSPTCDIVIICLLLLRKELKNAECPEHYDVPRHAMRTDPKPQVQNMTEWIWTKETWSKAQKGIELDTES
jgi:hypothetical protein